MNKGFALLPGASFKTFTFVTLRLIPLTLPATSRLSSFVLVSSRSEPFAHFLHTTFYKTGCHFALAFSRLS
jgi:hypothetical protein